jgi:hypothetical protein
MGLRGPKIKPMGICNDCDRRRRLRRESDQRRRQGIKDGADPVEEKRLNSLAKDWLEKIPGR